MDSSDFDDSSDEDAGDLSNSRRRVPSKEGSSDTDDADERPPPRGTGAAAGAQEQPPPTANAFEHPEAANAEALAGHPEDGQAGQSVADGTAPGMNGATLDEAAADRAVTTSMDGARASMDSAAAGNGPMPFGEAGVVSAPPPIEPQRPPLAPVPASVFAQQLGRLSLDAEPPPLQLSRFTHFMCVFVAVLTASSTIFSTPTVWLSS